MNEKLRLFKLERELKEKGQELSEKDSNDKDKNTRMKVHVLDKHIFESMANLIFFFEYIAKNDGLREVFDNDIEELFFATDDFKEPAERRRGMSYRRLIESTITWDKRKDPHNFRLMLFHTLQNIIVKHILLSLRYELGDSVVKNVVLPDFSRVWAWTKFISRKSEKYGYSKKTDDFIHRPILF